DHVVPPMTQPSGVDDDALAEAVARRPAVLSAPFPRPEGIYPHPMWMRYHNRRRCCRRRRDDTPAACGATRITRPIVRAAAIAGFAVVAIPVDFTRRWRRFVRWSAFPLRPLRVSTLTITTRRRTLAGASPLLRRSRDAWLGLVARR